MEFGIPFFLTKYIPVTVEVPRRFLMKFQSFVILSISVVLQEIAQMVSRKTEFIAISRKFYAKNATHLK